MATSFGLTLIKSKFESIRVARPPFLRFGSKNVAEEEFLVTEQGDTDLCLLLENLVIPKLLAGPVEDSLGFQTSMPKFGSGSMYRFADTPAPDSTKPKPGIAADPETIANFARLSLDSDTPSLFQIVEQFLDNGHCVEAIYVELLAPTARYLGQLWDEDAADFLDVSMGLWRIQELLRELSLRAPPPGRPYSGSHAALFSPMPGEEHGFGTTMISECFHRAGWDSQALTAPDKSELLGNVSDAFYDLVGLTVSCDCHKDHLAGLIAAIRAVSRNPATIILVGGRFINEHPGIVTECHADGTAADARSAVRTANQLVSARSGSLVSAM